MVVVTNPKFRTRSGDLITKGLAGEFDVIIQGCNCFNRQKSGLAKEMSQVFATHMFPLEDTAWMGERNKLGMIDYKVFSKETADKSFMDAYVTHQSIFNLTVVNCYTQFNFATEDTKDDLHLNYVALAMCLDKINHTFKGKRIGVPFIGCGLANGSKTKVYKMLKTRLPDCDVTLVRYAK